MPSPSTTKMPGRAMGTPRPPAFRRRLAIAVPLALVGMLVLTSAASAGLLAPEAGGSKNADSIRTLYWLVFGLGMIIFVGVEGVLIYSLFKYRARKGAVAAQIHGNTQLEIGWTVGAAVILVFIAVFTFATLPSIRNPPNSDEGISNSSAGITSGVAVSDREKLPPNGKSLAINVNGQQYVWRYTYADGDNNPLNNVFAYEEMVVPVGVTVTLSIRAQDVAHSWWIPKLGGKFDAIPKHTNYTWFQIPADKAGTTFRGQCAELCGRNHANMIAAVRAVTPAQFDKWLSDKKAQLKASDAAAAQQRKQVDAGQNP
jgi:cytochrome c oxidase subunit II